jgi:hypothetical protein
MRDGRLRGSNFVLSTILIVVMVGLTLNLGKPCYGSMIRVAIGSDVSTLIEQSWPPAFREVSLWMAGWLWTLNDVVGLEGGIAVFDLKSMRVSSPFSYFAGVNFQPLRILNWGFGVRLGVVHTPKHGWVAPYVGGQISRTLFGSGGSSFSAGIEWTEGGGSYAAGWCLWASVCTYWGWSF